MQAVKGAVEVDGREAGCGQAKGDDESGEGDGEEGLGPVLMLDPKGEPTLAGGGRHWFRACWMRASSWGRVSSPMWVAATVPVRVMRMVVGMPLAP